MSRVIAVLRRKAVKVVVRGLGARSISNSSARDRLQHLRTTHRCNDVIRNH